MVGSDWLVGLFSLASKVEGRQGGRETHTHTEREREPYYAVGSAKPITHSHHARMHATIYHAVFSLGLARNRKTSVVDVLDVGWWYNGTAARAKVGCAV